MKRIPTERIQKLMAEGRASPSLVTSMLERKFSSGVTPEEESTVHNIAFTVYGAASITTTASMTTFFYLMSKHRDIQRKAQAELDEVIGTKRLPTYEDRPNLPYIEAVYRELMRLGAPLPRSTPHATLETTFTKDTSFRKVGSLVYFFKLLLTKQLPTLKERLYSPTYDGRIYRAMNHDEAKYPDPYAFKPDRFFDASGKLNDDSRILAYGFGRRVCVGQHVASSIMWMVIASVLACFDISAATDANGNDLPINERL
ncbi:cytochrome P450 [Agrocybe pediades]|nr:cytochrome P450 [Agrocybe pediades]